MRWRFLDHLDFSEHFRVMCAKAARSIHALKVLRAHGLRGLISGRFAGLPPSATSLTQHLPGGVIPNYQCLHFQAVVNKLRRFGLLPPEFPPHEELCECMCVELFRQVLYNRFHFLHQLLPPVKERDSIWVQPNAHNRIIPRADNSFHCNFCHSHAL